jgi:hypothetical protein
MKKFSFLNKDLIQYIQARNAVEKQILKAYDPLPLELSSSLGNDLTISDDGKYIVIGDNVSYVKITGFMQFYSSSGDAISQNIQIRRLRNSTSSVVATGINYGTSITVEKIVYLYVKKGDKLFITSTKNCVLNSASTGGIRSGIIVEKIA